MSDTFFEKSSSPSYLIILTHNLIENKLSLMKTDNHKLGTDQEIYILTLFYYDWEFSCAWAVPGYGSVLSHSSNYLSKQVNGSLPAIEPLCILLTGD